MADDIAEASAAFARVEQATQLVIGAVALESGGAITAVDCAADLIGRIGAVDVHIVGTEVLDSLPSGWSLPHRAQPDGQSALVCNGPYASSGCRC